MWPGAIVAIEEAPPINKHRRIAGEKQVFVHSNDFEEPIELAEGFDSVLERLRQAHIEEQANESD